jgi:hypothetical protein
VRCEIVRLKIEDQWTLGEIAAHFGLSYGCVRKWWRTYRDGGREALNPVLGRPPNGPLSTFHPLIRYVALRLKRQHPKRGPTRILEMMKGRPSLRHLKRPSPTQLWRYWSSFGPRLIEPRRRRAGPDLSALGDEPTQVHERWQIDFKGAQPVSGCGAIVPFNLRDEVGRATVGSYVYGVDTAQGGTRHLTLEEVMDALRASFTRWGLPDRIQSDRDPLFVSNRSGDPFPSRFTLWLTALGIRHELIPPYSPKKNGVVERYHRTWHDYVVAGVHFQGIRDLQEQTDRATYLSNYVLPSRAKGCHGQPPAVAHPDLLIPRRPFRREWEMPLLDLKRVDSLLAQGLWSRRVSRVGQISLGGRTYNMGIAHAGQIVEACFHPGNREFAFFTTKGEEIKRLPAKGLDPANIIGLKDDQSLDLPPQQLALPLNSPRGYGFPQCPPGTRL